MYNFLGLVNNVNRTLNEVELTAGNFHTATGWYNHAKDAVNFAIQRINDEPVEWPFYLDTATLVLTPEQTRYPFPADCKRVDFNSFRLKANPSFQTLAGSLFPLDYEEFLDKYSGIEDEPEAWSNIPEAVLKTNGMSFGIVPPPDRAYTIAYEYYKVPLDLFEPTDVPSIPIQYRSVIHRGAMHYGYLFRGDLEAATVMEGQFEDSIRDMRRALISNRTEYVRSTYIQR